MKNVKRRMELFSLYDRSGLEEHLRKMAEKGWLLEKIGQLLWTYQKIEPKKLVFSVCYFPKASQFDPHPSEEQETFYDFCEHTGWVLAASNAQLQVFYNERPQPVPIETDPMQEVETIHRAMKKSFLPAQAAMAVVGLLNGRMFVSGLRRDLIGTLSSTSLLFSCLCWIIILLLTVTETVAYFRWHRKAVKAAEQGEFYGTRSRRKFQLVCLVLIMAGLGYYLLSILTAGNKMMMALAVGMFLIYAPGIFLGVNGLKRLLKKRGASTRFNRIVTMVGGFVLGMVLMGGVIRVVTYGDNHGWFKEPDEETYEWMGHTVTASNDPIPLTVDEMMGATYEGYDREKREERSFLLTHMEVDERPRFDMDRDVRKSLPQLEYEVVVVKVPFLYEMCREQMLHEHDNWNWGEEEENWHVYTPVDPAPWGAVEAYRWQTAYGVSNMFLLCYGDRMVELDFTPPGDDWAPTGAQMALVGEKLGHGPL